VRDSFSHRQMSYYFGEPLSYKRPLQIGGFGLACIAFVFLPLKLGANVVFITVLLGLASVALGAWFAWHTYHYPPTEEEYDGWVEAQVARMMDHARVALHAGSHENLQVIDSAVLPGSRKSKKDYQEDEVKVKRGKDGIWRYSVHDYSFVLAGASFLATFNAKVSALNQGRHEFHATTEYMYSDIVGMTTQRSEDNLEFQGKFYPYAVEECSIHISNGRTIDVGAAINARPVRQTSKLPTLTTMHAQATVTNFRELLRTKKQASYGLPPGQVWSGLAGPSGPLQQRI
jgi:hypothetical protein